MNRKLKVIHLQLKETHEHYYFGSLQALCKHFDKDAIGVVYSYLRAVKLHDKKYYENNKCIIRPGYLITATTEPQQQE